MAQQPGAAQPMDEEMLEQILIRAKTDVPFRDRLLGTPKEALTSVGVRPDPKWIRFFDRLTAANFESSVQDKIDNDPTGEAEAGEA